MFDEIWGCPKGRPLFSVPAAARCRAAWYVFSETAKRKIACSPEFARRGVGRLVLSLCEDAAAAEGFRTVELAATKGGLPLYRACGYREIEAVNVATPSGISVPIVRMRKDI